MPNKTFPTKQNKADSKTEPRNVFKKTELKTVTKPQPFNHKSANITALSSQVLKILMMSKATWCNVVDDANRNVNSAQMKQPEAITGTRLNRLPAM